MGGKADKNGGTKSGHQTEPDIQREHGQKEDDGKGHIKNGHGDAAGEEIAHRGQVTQEHGLIAAAMATRGQFDEKRFAHFGGIDIRQSHADDLAEAFGKAHDGDTDHHDQRDIDQGADRPRGENTVKDLGGMQDGRKGQEIDGNRIDRNPA